MNSVLGTGVHEAAMQTAYDDEVCFRAVERIRELSLRPDRRPFFLVASFTNPHDPWEVRARHWDVYRDEEIELPAVPRIPRDQADPHSLRLRDMYGIDERPLTDAEVVRARHGYYAAITYMDELVGEVLAALAATGLEEETVVAFTADHGEMAGERGLWYKMSFLDGSARIPFIWRGPGIVCQETVGPVSQLDLAPTLAELAGAAAPDAGFAGRSLARVLRGEGPAEATVAAEYLAEGVTHPAVMLRRDRYKLVRCPGDPDLLFDLEADPRELRNLAQDPAHARAREALEAEMAPRWDLAALREEVLESQSQRRIVASALARGAHTPWDHQPHVDASRQYVRGPAAEHPRPGAPLMPGGLPLPDDPPRPA
jgi:choline-sulfatase